VEDSRRKIVPRNCASGRLRSVPVRTAFRFFAVSLGKGGIAPRRSKIAARVLKQSARAFSDWGRSVAWSVVVPAACLTAIGCAAIARAAELSDNPEWFGRFARQQAFFAVGGFAMLLALSVADYRWAARWAYGLLILSLLLLCAVFFFAPINNACRWVRVGPFGFQPAELAKWTFVCAVARHAADSGGYRTLRSFLVPLGMLAAVVGLILKQPDLGTAAVFVPVLLLMLYVGGAGLRSLLVVVALGAACLPLLWAMMNEEQRSRVGAVFERIEPDKPPAGGNYQLYQARRVMSLGGFWGSAVTGEPVDETAVYRVPEAHNDFVFCVVVERWGIVGGGAVLLLHAVLAWRCLAVARKCGDAFGRLFIVGWTALTAVQTVINVGMTAGLLPVTGLPLPLLSYGGSALATQAVGIGLILSIGRRTQYEFGPDPFRRADSGGDARHAAESRLSGPIIAGSGD